ncbi:hypothetical protein LPJ61_000062 [Coemansia biformis]|uniref:Carbohydrate-binding module family 19 domain-containing protein n=1 Tax=Coemansia biformis TaxID=1286918 RepID=A0A9W8D0W0_9FUNG|nr:hypothetical protein LPJ61_000062 [Coemansia biformis]
MVAFAPALVALAALASIAAGQQCTGNTSKCPNGIDGVSQTYLQCNSWTRQFQPASCPTGQVCFVNPTRPSTVMCGLPGTGTLPAQGKCTDNTAKCASPGTSGVFYQCESWAGLFVQTKCPAGLFCHNNASNTGVFCA